VLLTFSLNHCGDVNKIGREMSIRQELVQVENPQSQNLIFGQTHFIKSVEDLYEALIQTAPGVKFGIAFCEASGERLVRFDGNDAELLELAKKNAVKIGCGHTFVIFMKDMFPINCLNRVKDVPEVCRVFAATSNPLQVIVAVSEQGRGVLGVIDGEPPLGVESEGDQEKRRAFLRMIKYKK